MALNLILGPSGSGKTHSLFKYALNEAKIHRDINYIVIVPEQYTLSTQKELIRLSDNHGILNVDVLSFARLSYRMFEEVGFGETSGILMDDMGKNLVLRLLSSEKEEDLSVLSANIKKLSYITEVKSLISEFKQYRVDDEKIDNMILEASKAGKNLLASKLKDVKILYNAFNDYIKDKYTTTEEILELASRTAFKSEKLKKSVVMFDGFTGFTPVQYGLINSLLQISPDIYITLLNDERDGMLYNTEHELFYMSFDTKNKLIKMANENNVCINNEMSLNDLIPKRYDEKKTRLIHLEKNLFREYKKPFTDAINNTGDTEKLTKTVNDEIRIFTALNPLEEIKNVAVTIKKLVSENGYKYKDIAVATGDLETYTSVILREFKKYDIPVFTDKKNPILLNPFTEYIRAMIEIILTDWRYEAVFRYLRLPLQDFKTDDIDQLENFVLAKGIKGYANWNTDWTIKYTSNRKNINEEENRQINNINNLREKVISNLACLDKICFKEDEKGKKIQTESVNDYNIGLYGIFREQHIQEKLFELANSIKKTDDIFAKERANEFERVYSETIKLMEKMSELIGTEKIALEEYRDLLDAGFDEIRIGIIPSVTDYVQVGDITRSRFEKVHALFIVGANDGVIPQNNTSSGIISDIEKEFLISYTPDIELSPSSRMKSYTGQLYLYMLMTKPDEKLFISYSRLNSASESIKPSYIVNVVKDLFPDIKEERDIYNELDYVYNEESLLSYLNNSTLEDDDALGVISYLSLKDQYKDVVNKILTSYFSDGVFSKTDEISKAVANILYTSSLKSSITRLERYAECAYRYFLQYGLSLSERELFDFNASDMGTLFHDALENYSRIITSNGESWIDINEAKRNEYISLAIDNALSEGNFSAVYSTFRKKYVLYRVKRILERSIEVLSGHLKVGKFVPLDAEVEFSSASNLKAFNFALSDTERMHLSGKIDRIDTYEDSEHLYIKIIDYKSGNKSFDLMEVYKGLSLQLVVYMNAAKELLHSKTTKEIVPAGILYYHVDDPMVDSDTSDTNEQIQEKILKELKMKGLVNSEEDVYRLMDDSFDKKSCVIPVDLKVDGSHSSSSSVVSKEDFEVISEFVSKKLCSLGKDILDGKVEAKPVSAKGIDESRCQYCPYTTVCKYNKHDYDDEEEGYSSKQSREEIIEMMKQELLD